MFNPKVPTPLPEIKKKHFYHNSKAIFTTPQNKNLPIALVDREGLVWHRNNDEDWYRRGRISYNIRFTDTTGFKFIYPGENIPQEPKQIINKEIKLPEEYRKPKDDPFGDLKYEV
jgi:hypothetical protein